MYYDIVLLPSHYIRRKIGKSIGEASQFHRTEFVVDNGELIPHISLFHVSLDSGGRQKVLKLMERWSKQIDSINFVVTEVESRGGLVSLALGFQPELYPFQKNIRDRVAPFRDGSMPILRLGRMPKGAMQAREKYGTQFGVQSYNPHITLALFRDSNQAERVARSCSKLAGMNFTAKSLALCEVNNWYQVTRVIKSFTL